MISPQFYPVPASDVYGRILDNEAVLVLTMKGKVEVLNEVGARIWTLANGSRSVQDIASDIYREFKVTESQALIDSLEFIARLTELGVFTLEDKPIERN